MSLILKKLGTSVRVLRRKTVSHFVEPHGKVFAYKDTYIGSIPLDAIELPIGFGKNHPELTPHELSALEVKIFAKARCAKEEEARQRAHELDPDWRLRDVRSTLSAVVALPSLVAADRGLID